MSDILFLSVKEHAGKLRTAEGFQSATGDLVSLTANTGKDMYLGAAKANIHWNTTGTSSTQQVEVVLKANGTIIETWQVGMEDQHPEANYSFNVRGVKVAAGQIIKLEVITIHGNTDVEGSLVCFEEDTGNSPFVASEFS